MGQRLPVPARNSSMEPALSISGAFQSLHLDHSGFHGPEMRQNPSNRSQNPAPGTAASWDKCVLNSRRLKRLERRLPGQVLFLVFCGEGRRSTSVSTCQSSLQISDTATARLNLCSLLLIKARDWFNVLIRPKRGIFLGRPAIPLC